MILLYLYGFDVERNILLVCDAEKRLYIVCSNNDSVLRTQYIVSPDTKMLYLKDGCCYSDDGHGYDYVNCTDVIAIEEGLHGQALVYDTLHHMYFRLERNRMFRFSDETHYSLFVSNCDHDGAGSESAIANILVPPFTIICEVKYGGNFTIHDTDWCFRQHFTSQMISFTYNNVCVRFQLENDAWTSICIEAHDSILTMNNVQCQMATSSCGTNNTGNIQFSESTNWRNLYIFHRRLESPEKQLLHNATKYSIVRVRDRLVWTSYPHAKEYHIQIHHASPGFQHVNTTRTSIHWDGGSGDGCVIEVYSMVGNNLVATHTPLIVHTIPTFRASVFTGECNDGDDDVYLNGRRMKLYLKN
jgi:hypothetical protein